MAPAARPARHASSTRLMVRQVLANWPGRLAITCVLLIFALITIGPIILADAAATGDISVARQGPSASHPLGTDDLGRDVLARVVVASQTTVGLALAAVGIAMLAGYTLGLVAAVSPRRFAKVVVLGLDLWLAFPPLIVAIFVSAVMGQSTLGAVVAVAIAYAPQFARTMSNLGRGVMTRDYVRVVELLGIGRLRLLGRHIVPNVASPLWIQVASGVGDVMVTLSALSFLGLGVQLPGYDWGSMLADYLPRIFTDPAVVLGPAAAITIVGIMFSFIGEAGALTMDPQRWTGRKDARAAAPAGAAPAGAAPAGTADEVPETDRVIDVADLHASYNGIEVVRGVTFQVRAGEILGLIGESGSGKSTIGSALTGLLPHSAQLQAHTLIVADAHAEAERRSRAATVFQNPMESLTPTMSIRTQLREAIGDGSSRDSRTLDERCLAALRDVRIKDPDRVLKAYPHELSGGMRQRVMIALGLLREPRVLIADEPTTALDVTTQAHLLRLIRSIADERHMGVVFISHDFGVIRSVCDRVVVLRDGEVVETLEARQLDDAQHPYTRELLAAVPRLKLSESVQASLAKVVQTEFEVQR